MATNEDIRAFQDLSVENARLRAALKNVCDDVLAYERINNLAPSPGRKYCWDSVGDAIAILNQQ